MLQSYGLLKCMVNVLNVDGRDHILTEGILIENRVVLIFVDKVIFLDCVTDVPSNLTSNLPDTVGPALTSKKTSTTSPQVPSLSVIR